jgi:hypothetical protein
MLFILSTLSSYFPLSPVPTTHYLLPTTRLPSPSLVPREIFQQMARETLSEGTEAVDSQGTEGVDSQGTEAVDSQGTEAVDSQGTEVTTIPELPPSEGCNRSPPLWISWLRRLTMGTRLPPFSYSPPSRNPMWFRMS